MTILQKNKHPPQQKGYNPVSPPQTRWGGAEHNLAGVR